MPVTAGGHMKRVLKYLGGLAALLLVVSFSAAAEQTKTPATPTGMTEKAMFAGGCFWCPEADLQHLPGVFAISSGYTGGDQGDQARPPSYDEVCQGGTGQIKRVWR